MNASEAAELLRHYSATPGWTSTVEQLSRMDNQRLWLERVSFQKEHVFRTNAQCGMEIIDAILTVRQEANT